MPTNQSLMHARFAAVRAAAEAAGVLAQIEALTETLSGKVFSRQREQRRALWEELRVLAEAQVNGLKDAPGETRRKPAPKPRTPRIDNEHAQAKPANALDPATADRLKSHVEQPGNGLVAASQPPANVLT